MTGKEAERLAAVEVQLASIIRQLAEQRADMKELHDDMKPLIAAFQQRKGAMWILFVLGSIIGAVVAGFSNLSKLFGH